MISNTTFQEIVSLIKEDKVINAFKYYKDKYDDLLYLKYNEEAVFAFTKNKNGVYEGQAFFIEIENTNDILIAIKERLEARFIPYIQNQNRKELFDRIDDSLIHLKMHKYVINQKLDALVNNFEIIDAIPEDDLKSFYINCFKDEFDENAIIWLRDFEQMEKNIEKGNKLIKIDNEIAASIMYWVFEKSIFIFLLGTNPNFRRRKLAYILIQEVQKKFPEKELALTTWAGGNTEKFYLNIGFEKLQMVYVSL